MSRYVDEHRGRFGVEPICKTLGVSVSAYYQRRSGPSLDSRGRGRAAARLASVGTVGDAYDNALAESFVDSFKTELIADRVWRSRAQLELAVVEYIGWFNDSRLHQALGDLPPSEFETLSQTSTLEISLK